MSKKNSKNQVNKIVCTPDSGVRGWLGPVRAQWPPRQHSRFHSWIDGRESSTTQLTMMSIGPCSSMDVSSSLYTCRTTFASSRVICLATSTFACVMAVTCVLCVLWCLKRSSPILRPCIPGVGPDIRRGVDCRYTPHRFCVVLQPDESLVYLFEK